MATAGTLEYLISVNSGGLSSGLKNADNKVKGFGDKMSKWAVAKGQLLGRFIEKAAQVTIEFVKGSVKESMEFDKSMSKVAATMGKTVDEMSKETGKAVVKFGKETKTFEGNLSDFARFMGENTAYTASEAAEALNYMALAGYNVDKSMQMLPKVLNLAAAGTMNLARASDIVTDAQSALGLTIPETENLVDQMAKTASRTNTSVEQLGEGILTVGGTAKQLMGGTVELTALLGALADNGIKGAEGGTALRNVLQRLENPTSKAAKALKDLGVDAFENGNLRSLPEIFKDFNAALGDKTMEERAELLGTIFNVRDLKSIEAFLGKSPKQWADLMLEIVASKDAAQEMANTQLDNLNGDVTKFKSALGEAKLTIVEGLTPSLRKLVQKGIGWVQQLTNAFKEKGLKGAIKEAWSVAKEAFTEGKNKIRIGIASLLDLGEDASWTDIAKGISGKIKLKLGEKKLKLANYFELGEDASWADIAGKVVEKLTKNLKKKGDFIKALVLGDDYKDGESTWSEVAGALADKVKGAFKEGGILDILLGESSQIIAGAAEFGAQLIEGIAGWMEKNPKALDDMFDSIVNAIVRIAPALGKALASVGSALLDAIFGKGSGAAVIESIKTLLGIKDKPTKEQKESGKSTRDYLDEKSKDEAVAWMDRAFGDTPEAQEAKGQYKKYRDSKEGKPNAGRWMRDDVDALDLLLAKADEASGGVQEAAEDAVDAVDTVTEHSTEKASKSVEKAKSGVLDVFNSFKDNYDRNSKFFDEDWVGFLGDALKDAGYEGEQLNNILSQLDFSTLESKGEEVSSYIESILTANPPKADVALQPDDSAITAKLSGGYDATVRLHEAEDGSHAKGLTSVPYDNYNALLHRGEMVLTASQARRYRDGGSGGSAEIVGAIQSLKNEMANMKIMVGQRVFGRTVVDYSGRRMNNYLGNADSKLAAGYGT